MERIPAYIGGRWILGQGEVPIQDAYTGKTVALLAPEGLPVQEALAHAREVGGPALRALGFAERGRRLRALAEALGQYKEELYALSHTAGATREDAWYDVDGGIGVLYTYSSLARNLPEGPFLLDEAYIPLSRDGSFLGRHLLLPREGVTVQVNAFNFPVWGLLEKLAPAFLAGVPTLVKPASPTAHIAYALVRRILETGLLPEGSLQFLPGRVNGLLEALTPEDSLYFTGSMDTAEGLRGRTRARFNAETDALNPALLGQGATEEDLKRLAQEVVQELRIKAGQRCTAIRRVLVPEGRLKELAEAILEGLKALRPGDPRAEGTNLGPLVSQAQKEEVERAVLALRGAGLEVLYQGEVPPMGAFFPPTLLLAQDPYAEAVHRVEAFGPVAALLPYRDREEAVRLALLAGGSLVATVATSDPKEAQALLLALAPGHGRLHLLNARTGHSSTGHGSPLPRLHHGGPGRAGGGEELGGMRSVLAHLRPVALQADPETLQALTGEYAKGAEKPASVHPFRKAFEDLEVGESLLTHRRTVTEADIALFSAISWDHFYAHTDEIAARASLFGRRVAHGYFVLSAAAGLFVDPAPGPVLANYGLEGLRFLEPVAAGDTLQARLTVKRKRPKDERTGVVEWAVEVTNQEGKAVAGYTLLTLVARRGEG